MKRIAVHKYSQEEEKLISRQQIYLPRHDLRERAFSCILHTSNRPCANLYRWKTLFQLRGKYTKHKLIIKNKVLMSFPLVLLKILSVYINSCVYFTWFRTLHQTESFFDLSIDLQESLENASQKFTRKY